MSEQGLSPQRRELANDQKKLYEDLLEPICERRAVTEATENAVRITIERATTIAKYPSSLDVAHDVEEEEDVIEMVSAMIIADATALASAQAAALAETSSLRVREARVHILQAEQRLESIKAAIRKRKLLDGDAENALKSATQEATQAHALLDAAEAAEKSALHTALHAEADAKAAENLAFITDSLNEKLLG